MEAGRTVLEGSAEVLAGDPRVQRAYLGGEGMVDSGERRN
jgi:ABC-type branched-subunit amino acid transport system ATPase component